ncbi:hypothetical protein H1P_380002 [Hyella patelloides LEGE 07179]|uniref:Uncharacterized protein n=1 Tax=Hyella patelloides LEGE 07179 TaxID=945734 RepID=A0A563VWR3_9CYAN|nr:hypothetical protein H1P_380002 [Hyella patelloides LEGE 07179]
MSLFTQISLVLIVLNLTYDKYFKFLLEKQYIQSVTVLAKNVVCHHNLVL